MTFEALCKHLQTSTRNVFIVGPFVGAAENYETQEMDYFTHKNLAKHTATFYQKLNEKFAMPQSYSPTFEVLRTLSQKGYIHTLYSQSYHPMYRQLNAFYLKGVADTFYCSNCNTSYTLDDLQLLQYKCHCGRIIRPKMMLYQDVYDNKRLEEFDTTLQNADTIFFIGFNFDEDVLLEQFYLTSMQKINKSGKQIITVAVGETDAQKLYDEYHFDFIVNENTDTAMTRFLEKMEAL